MAEAIEEKMDKFDIQKYRNDFPLLKEQAYGKPLVYFDNAATSQKPQPVIDAVHQFYLKHNANIHRGVFCLSEQATQMYENARHKIKNFINASSEKEIIFTRGTTEAINLVASTYGRSHIQKGDEILVTRMEHHSNIVPWQMLCEEKEAVLKVIEMNEDGELTQESFESQISDKTKLLALVHVSNAIGTINPVKKMIRKAHENGIDVLVDGAQAVSHLKVDVQDLDADFYVFSGHKLFGPTGIGVLYGRESLLEVMPPYQGGGDMIERVSFEKTTYNSLPYKFEAGTPNIDGVIGLGAAVDYVNQVGLENIESYERELLDQATSLLLEIPGLQIIGNAKNKTSIISFTLGEAHAQDIGTILDREGIAIRAGHHCAMPAMEFFGVSGTARASFAFYNTKEEVEKLVEAIKKVQDLFK